MDEGKSYKRSFPGSEIFVQTFWTSCIVLHNNNALSIMFLFNYIVPSCKWCWLSLLNYYLNRKKSITISRLSVYPKWTKKIEKGFKMQFMPILKCLMMRAYCLDFTIAYVWCSGLFLSSTLSYGCLALIFALSYHFLAVIFAFSYHCLALIFAFSYHCLALIFALSYHCLALIFVFSYHCLAVIFALSNWSYWSQP